MPIHETTDGTRLFHTDVGDGPPGAGVDVTSSCPVPGGPGHRFQPDDGPEGDELPARQVLAEIEQLAMPGDDPHLGRNRPILQGT